MTRRHLLGQLAAVSSAAASTGPKSTGFALIGDRPHNSDYIRTALRRTICKEMGVSVDFRDEVELLTAQNLAGYKLLIVLRDGFLWPDGYLDENSNAAWHSSGRPQLVSEPAVTPKREIKGFAWMTPEQGRAVQSFVRNGGGALLLHNVTHIGTHNAEFRELLGASYLGHPPVRTFKVRVTNATHPITRGVGDFVVTDEQHYMTYDKDRKHLLLESVNEQGLAFQEHGPSAPAGWAFEYGKGRVCYFSPGHLLTVLWNPEYVKLQQNAVRWLLKQV
ncbi:MAG: ThuA domain-containing protein [Acidobacteria bacterium]|nr:ThuA domain-containing protein [Acidobacteriota bacterium]